MVHPPKEGANLPLASGREDTRDVHLNLTG